MGIGGTLLAGCDCESGRKSMRPDQTADRRPETLFSNPRDCVVWCVHSFLEAILLVVNLTAEVDRPALPP